MMTKNTRVTIWGDSILRGIVYDKIKDKYAFLKSSCIDLIQAETGITIKNNSKFCQTTTRALHALKCSLPLDNNYDYGIIELGGNDSDFNWDSIAASPEAYHLPKTPLDIFLSNIEEMVNTFREYDIKPIIINLHPISSSKYLDWISRKNPKEKILCWLKSEDNIYKHQERYSLALSFLSFKLNVQLLNLRDELLSKRNYLDYLCEDGIHLNKEGHLYLKEIFCKFNKGEKDNEKIPYFY